MSGPVIAVRGYYRFGMELGSLYGRNCPKKLVLDGAERAQAVDVSYGPMVDDKELALVANNVLGVAASKPLRMCAGSASRGRSFVEEIARRARSEIH